MKRYKNTNYLISREGKVWTENRNKFLSPGNVKGYQQVQIMINGKRYIKYVHRLVAELYILNPNNYPHINHINNDKTDNRVENLEWCTVIMNKDHKVKQKRHLFGKTHKNVKLTEEQVIEIRRLYKETDLFQYQIGEMFGITQAAVCDIVNRYLWNHI